MLFIHVYIAIIPLHECFERVQSGRLFAQFSLYSFPHAFPSGSRQLAQPFNGLCGVFGLLLCLLDELGN